MCCSHSWPATVDALVACALADLSRQFPDPKKMQLSLTGFLESSTPEFMSALWALLLDAQDAPGGIPRELVELKKAELAKARAADAEAVRAASVRGAGASGMRSGEGGRPGFAGGRGGPPYGGRGGGRGPANVFQDKSGNVTERSQDVGWVSECRVASSAGSSALSVRTTTSS